MRLTQFVQGVVDGDFLAKAIRSPLLQFAIVGVVIYAVYAVTRENDTGLESATTITLSADFINRLEEGFAKRWNRPPTPEERQGLIDQFVRETVLYREAVAMGLDQDDMVIRRRVGQKLEFLFRDLADAIAPSEQDLRDYFDAHREQYREPALITMSHVFVDPDRRGDRTLDDAAEMLAELQELEDATERAATIGDPLMLQSYYPERTQSDMARLFGQEFARAIFELEPGRWHGPVLSGYGTHLVYVHRRDEFPPPALEQVQDRVALDWQDANRVEVLEESVATMVSRYTVVIEDDQTETASTR